MHAFSNSVLNPLFRFFVRRLHLNYTAQPLWHIIRFVLFFHIFVDVDMSPCSLLMNVRLVYSYHLIELDIEE